MEYFENGGMRTDGFAAVRKKREAKNDRAVFLLRETLENPVRGNFSLTRSLQGAHCSDFRALDMFL